MIATIVVVEHVRGISAFLDVLIASIEGHRSHPRTPVSHASWTVVPETVVSPREAFFADNETVPASAAAGRVSAELIAPYPPGVPVLAPGELITAAAIESLLPSGRTVRAEKLLADFDQNGKVLAEVIGVFLVDGPRYLEAIRQARASGDTVAAAASVHALKGSVGLFSSEAYELVRGLEQAVKAGEPAADARQREVESAIARLCA